MSAKKQGSSGWLVVVAVLAVWFGLRSGNGASQSPPAALAASPAVPVAAPRAREPSLGEFFAALDPERKLARARDFAALGLRSPQERPEAYAIALRLLDGFPVEHPSAKQAKTLRTELVARQALPAAERRTPTESELLVYLVRLGKAQTLREPSRALVGAGLKSGAAPVEIAAATPRRAPSRAFTGGGCEENGSCFGDVSAATGRPKTVEVHGYYRKNGTYVRGHFRSK